MSLLRAVARTMLASHFVLNGLQAFRHPEPLVPAAQPLAERLLPLGQKVIPQPLVAYLPDDARGLVRCTGITQVVGGFCLATGIFRRLGAGLLAATLIPQLATSDPRKPPAEGAAASSAYVTNVALTGAVILAALDTQGHPDLAWRARAGKVAQARAKEQQKSQAARDTALSIKRARRAARAARSARTVESARS